MRELVARVLGHSVFSQEIVDQISALGSQRIILQGKSGTGKSFIAETIAKKCEALGLYTIVLRGDCGRLGARYHPLASLRFRTKATDLVAGGLESVWEAVGEFRPGTKALEKAIKVALTASQRYFGEPKSAVGDHVCEAFIDGLQRVARKKDILIVLDDIQYFDQDSLYLIDTTIKEFSSRASLLRSIKILATRNSDRPLPVQAQNVLKTFSAPRAVEVCPRHKFPLLLKAFGIHHPLDNVTLDLLFDCAAGNLEVIRALGEELSGDQHFAGRNEDELFQEVLGRTLDRTLEPNDPLLTILSIASVAGTGINRTEVACLTGCKPEELSDAFKRARDLSLVEETDTFFRFRHEVTWRFFCAKAAAKEREIHAQYSKCLKSIRPSSYEEFQRHLLAADLLEQATIAGAQAVLQKARRHPLPLPSEIDREILSWSNFPIISSTTLDLLEAMTSLRRGRLADAIAVLDSISEVAPAVLLAERDFVRATVYLRRPSRTSINQAIGILKVWDDGLSVEDAELWGRLKSTLVFALVQAGRFEEAAFERTTLFRKLSRYIAFDDDIRRALSRWELNANMLLEPEAANRQIERAAKVLIQAYETGATISPTDTFVALTNFSSSELALAHYERASGAALQAIKLKRITGFDFLASPVPALSNLLVSELMAGRMSIQACSDYFLNILENATNDEDFLLLASNCLAILVDAGDVSRASELVSHVTSLQDLGDCEDYVGYFWLANRASLSLLKGQASLAIEAMRDIEPKLANFPPGDRRTMTVRHQRVMEALAQGISSTRDLDEQLRLAPPGGGPAWRFFGRLAIFSPIEIWADI